MDEECKKIQDILNNPDDPAFRGRLKTGFMSSKKKWYKILDESGFDDKESRSYQYFQDEPIMYKDKDFTIAIRNRVTSYPDFKDKSSVAKFMEDHDVEDLGLKSNYIYNIDESKLIYYDRAMEYARFGKFKDLRDRYIWRKHAEGCCVRTISKYMRKHPSLKHVSNSYPTVSLAVRRIRKDCWNWHRTDPRGQLYVKPKKGEH